MPALQTRESELLRFSQVGEEDNAVDAAWPVYWETGARSTAVVYVALEPGMRLPEHTDSAEELLVVLEGAIEATIGDEHALVRAGGPRSFP